MFSAVSFEDGILMVRGDTTGANQIVVGLRGQTLEASGG